MQKKLWTKNFCLISLSSFFIYVVYYSLMVVIAVYALDHLAATASQAGLATGIFLVAGLIARFFTGYFLTIFSKKKMMLIGTILYLCALLFYFPVENVYLLICIRFLQGLGFGISTTAMITVVAEIIPKERQGEGISYFLLSVTLASAVGPFLGLYFYQSSNFFMILYWSLFLAVWSLLFVIMLQIEDSKRPMSSEADMLGIRKYLEYETLPIAGIGFIVFLCYSSIISFFSAYIVEINLMEAGKYFFLIYSLSIIVSRPFIGKLSDTKGNNFVMYPSFVLFAAGLFIISQAYSNIVLFISSVFMGIGFGTFSSIGQVISIKGVAKGRMGIATSTFLAISEMGIGIGPFLLGYFIPIVGFRNLYLTMGIGVLIAMLLYGVLCKRKNEPF